MNGLAKQTRLGIRRGARTAVAARKDLAFEKGEAGQTLREKQEGNRRELEPSVEQECPRCCEHGVHDELKPVTCFCEAKAVEVRQEVIQSAKR